MTLGRFIVDSRTHDSKALRLTWVTLGNISEYTDVLMQTFGVSLPTAEELPEDDELNAAVDAVAEAAGLEETKNSQAE